MMALWDKKKALQTIMQRRNPSSGEATAGPAPMEEQKVSDEEGEIDPRHMASQDALAAIHQKDPKKFMDAMSAFYDLHHSRSMTEAPDTDED